MNKLASLLIGFTLIGTVLLGCTEEVSDSYNSEHGAPTFATSIEVYDESGEYVGLHHEEFPELDYSNPFVSNLSIYGNVSLLVQRSESAYEILTSEYHSENGKLNKVWREYKKQNMTATPPIEPTIHLTELWTFENGAFSELKRNNEAITPEQNEVDQILSYFEFYLSQIEE